MKYIQVDFICTPNTEIITDILADVLAGIDFESFVPSEKGISAFIPAQVFSNSKLQETLLNFPLDAQFTFSFNELEEKNWNEEWEKNYFRPIVINDECIIHSSFHKPEGVYAYSILIDPKMAFGTGHHQTTSLVLKELLSMNLSGKSVLDMGCGTAVLAILASMKGAAPITAIDIDEWAYRNAKENIALNNADQIEVLLGGAKMLGKQSFDVILANINRNILLQDIPSYVNVLHKGGSLIMSGFYKEDIPLIREKCEKFGLLFSRFSELDNWVSVVCIK